MPKLHKIRSAKNAQRNTAARGFTIIELMIATVVFSLILILITVGVIRFNQAYYRGLTQSNTQNVARSIMNNVAQTIQFSGGSVTAGLSGGTTYPTWSGLCVDDQFFQYQLGKELTPVSPNGSKDQVAQGMLKGGGPACSGATPGQSPSGSELLSPHMRLSDLEVTSLGGNLFKITVRVVYGDDDLVCSQSVSGSCNSATSVTGATAKDAECKESAIGNSGAQFCAEADLSTTVQKRII